jgi:hypothetical protein
VCANMSMPVHILQLGVDEAGRRVVMQTRNYTREGVVVTGDEAGRRMDGAASIWRRNTRGEIVDVGA